MNLDGATLRLLGWGRTGLWARTAALFFEERLVELHRKRELNAQTRITKRSEFGACPGCGQTFQNRQRGWLRVYCSDSCRVRHHNRAMTAERRAREPRPDRCLCGAPLEQDWSTRVRRWCSEKCRRRHKSKETK